MNWRNLLYMDKVPTFGKPIRTLILLLFAYTGGMSRYDSPSHRVYMPFFSGQDGRSSSLKPT